MPQAPLAAPVAVGPFEPVSVAPPPYVIREGDNLWRIYSDLKAKGQFGGTWWQFISSVPEINDINDPDLIYPGTDLKLKK